MATMQTEERVGEAWKQHRMGNNSGAIEIFQGILNQDPGHVDALYGIGLAQRAEGKLDLAAEAFNKAAQLTQDVLNAVTTNDLNTDEDDRAMMLSRMISQRLEEIEAAS